MGGPPRAGDPRAGDDVAGNQHAATWPPGSLIAPLWPAPAPRRDPSSRSHVASYGRLAAYVSVLGLPRRWHRRRAVFTTGFTTGLIPDCSLPERSASCDVAHEALDEPADFCGRARHGR